MRDIKKLLLEIEQLATLDVHVAMSCFYVLFKEGKPFVGVSVRFAEIIGSCWGGIESGAKVIANPDGKSITVTGFVKDLEKNSNFSVQVMRRTVNYKGERMSSEEIIQATNAASSIAFRNALFKAIPAALFTTVAKNIKNYIVENIDESDVLELAIEYFSSKKISSKDLMKKLEVENLKGLTAEKIYLLIGLKNAIEEGDTTIHEAFGIEEVKPQRSSKYSFDTGSAVPEEKSTEVAKPTDEILIPKEEVISDSVSDKDSLKKGIGELSKANGIKPFWVEEVEPIPKEEVKQKRGKGRPKKKAKK